MNHRINSRVDGTKFYKMISATEEIQQDIVTGRIRHGSGIDSQTMCERFQIGEDTLGCVLDDLKELRFIEPANQSKSFLVSYSHCEAAALGAARQKSEGKILRKAVRNISTTGTQPCRKLLEDFDNASSLPQKMHANQKLLSMMYYGRELRYSSNALERNLHAYGKYFQFLWSKSADLVCYRQEINEFLNLCDRGEVDGASQSMLEHISATSCAIADDLILRDGVISEAVVSRDGIFLS